MTMKKKTLTEIGILKKGTVMQSLGDRMKIYEKANETHLTPRSYNMLRVDGKAFHSLTKKMKLEKPFDEKLIDVMNRTAIDLCAEVQGAKLGYVQSDEISIVFTDLDSTKTQQYFGGDKSKIVSITAATATESFNYHFLDVFGVRSRAKFDSRVWGLPDLVEVHNCFVWRQKDWERNSIQMLTRAHFSHKEVSGKNTSQMHDMLHGKGINWNDLDPTLKRGRFIEYEKGKGWYVGEPPVLTKDPSFVWNKVPKYGVLVP